jgi:Fe2+ transport protein
VIAKHAVASTAALVVGVLFVGGCVSSPNVPSLAGPSNPSSGVGPSPLPSDVSATASPSPVVSATIDVSPREQRVGGISLSLSFEAPRHMVDQTAVFNAGNADPARPTATLPDGVSKGAVVLSDMLHVTNNLDPTQLLPVDSAQAIMRHVVVQVGAGDGSQPVPYLGVSMDILLDGHPVGFGQAVVPMVAADASAPSLYYGNNIRLAQRGLYQVFIRLSRNALLGTDQPLSAQFNVSVR